MTHPTPPTPLPEPAPNAIHSPDQTNSNVQTNSNRPMTVDEPTEVTEPTGVELQIITCALQAFYRQGFHATGVEQLSQLAKVSKKTLYRYFPTKDELIVATLRLRHRDFLQRMQHFVGQQPVAERPLAYVDFIRDWAQQADFHGCMFINAAAEYAGFCQHETDDGQPEPAGQHTAGQQTAGQQTAAQQAARTASLVLQQCRDHKLAVQQQLACYCQQAGFSQAAAASQLFVLAEGLIVHYQIHGVSAHYHQQISQLARLLLNASR